MRESKLSGDFKFLELSPHSIEKQLSVEEQITKGAKILNMATSATQLHLQEDLANC